MSNYTTAPPASPRGSRKPINWPKGLTIGFRKVYDDQINRCAFQVRARKAPNARTFFFDKGNYAEKRLAALTELAEHYDYSKIPPTWLEAVADTHEGFLKQAFIICEEKAVCHYSYKHE